MLNTAIFIERATKIHGSKYSYECSEYVNSSTKVKIMCHEHGLFEQKAHQHLLGNRCKKCSNGARRLSQEDFIARSTEIHKGKYSYERVKYINCLTDVEIICPEHGSFWQRPDGHLAGFNCLKCTGWAPLSQIEFIDKANIVHSGQYSYENVVYKNTRTKITITCKRHGNFNQNPSQHLLGRGCKACASVSTEDFIKRAQLVHNGKYTYEKVNYKSAHDEVEITCEEHGTFFQIANSHLSGRGCRKCGGFLVSNQEEFIEQARLIHQDKYSYENVVYVKSILPVSITCKEHGPFNQKPNGHLSGQGCRKCSAKIVSRSSHEFEIEQFLKDNEISFIPSDRTVLAPKELDFYIPRHNLAIEMTGVYYHSDKFKKKNEHYYKWNECDKQGIQLLTVFEDEWVTKKDLIKSKILHLCGIDGVAMKGEISIRKIDNADADKFCDQYHVRGKAFRVKDSFGAFCNDGLVGVMTFGRDKGKIELSRFCSKGYYPTMFAELFTYAVDEMGYTEVVSYADRRYSNGDLHVMAGFEHEGNAPVEYYYVTNRLTYTKQSFTKKRIAEIFKVPVSKSARETLDELAVPRLYDCGKMRFIWRKPIAA